MKQTTIKLSLCMLLYTGSVLCKAQGFGFQVGSLRPIGDQSYILKPGYGGELMLSSGEIDDRWRFTGSIGFYAFKPTQDTFKTYTVEESYTSTLIPTTEVVKKYQILAVGFGCNFKVLPTKKLSPVIGLDFYTNIINFSVAGFDYDPFWRFSLYPKLGASYQIKNNWLVTGGMGIDMGYGNENGVQSYWRPFISLLYFRD